MTALAVFIATSLDGYIASVDGSIDWLEQAGVAGEDYGFDTFLDSVDALAMGRGTYDHIASLEPLPFGDRPLFVFTHRPPAPRAGVTFVSWSPSEALEHWVTAGLARVYVDGGRVVSDFLAAGLIDELTITTVPLLLGHGRPLFHPIGVSTRLRLATTRAWPSGMTQATYERAD